MASALTLLSDGAFKLYIFLCLRANRATARLEIDQGNIAKSLRKSRRSVIVYFEELKQRGVCQVEFAANQYSRGSAQICEAFWPYEIAEPLDDAEVINYVKRIRALCESRPCVLRAFAPGDEKLAQTFFLKNVPFEDVEHAFLLGCTRKYVSWLNGQISGPIASFGYFRSIIEEVAQMNASPDYWRYLSESLAKYERAWLAQSKARNNCVP